MIVTAIITECSPCTHIIWPIPTHQKIKCEDEAAVFFSKSFCCFFLLPQTFVNFFTFSIIQSSWQLNHNHSNSDGCDSIIDACQLTLLSLSNRFPADKQVWSENHERRKFVMYCLVHPVLSLSISNTNGRTHHTEDYGNYNGYFSCPGFFQFCINQ